MKYMVDVERQVFLHFLNRESAHSAGRVADVARDLLTLDLMLISHCSGMTVNISQMVEYSHARHELQSALVKLVSCGILVPTSRESNIEDFIRSRQSLYRHVQDRYPMYFGDTQPIGQFTIGHANSFSMTKLLRRDILDTSSTELTLLGRRARTGDLELFVQGIDPLQAILFREKEAPVTKASFAALAGGYTLPKEYVDSAARVFSALYNEHYARNHMAATCTGIQDVGYLDDLSLFPHYDIAVLRSVVFALGWDSVKRNSSDLASELCGLYGSVDHRNFVEHLHAFLYACYSSVRTKSNNVDTDNDTVQAIRTRLINLVARSIQSVDRQAETHDLRSFYLSAVSALTAAASMEASRDAVFHEAWEENMPPRRKARLLIVTATDTEDDAVSEALKTSGFRIAGVLALGQGYGELYSKGSSKEIVHARSSAGSIGSAGSELVTSEAMQAAGVNMVLAAGICFGLRDDKHSLGDVLVSEKVADYELTRVGETEVVDRGPRGEAGPKLLSATRIMRRQTTGAAFGIHHGLLLSGLKLVDDPELRGKLKERFPDAIGGEMEASGVMAAATRTGSEWIIIKAICDWGMGKDDKAQASAAANAAEFAVKVAECTLDAELTRIQ